MIPRFQPVVNVIFELARLETEKQRKMGYIAEHGGRFLTRRTVRLTQSCARESEQDHGPIDVEEEHSSQRNFVT